MAYKTLVFDLDGTLLNTTVFVAWAAITLLAVQHA